MSVKVRPLGNIVIIRRSAPDSVSAGGIYMAWDSDYKEDIGEVMYVGDGTRYRCKGCNTETRIPVDVKAGDIVLFSTNGHQITKINGEELIVTREASIIGVITEGKQGVESGTYKAGRQYMGVEVIDG